MNDERYVAAIEISSSKIVAAVGKMHSDGRLDIIATEQERAVESVRYGIIQNLEETSMRIQRVLNRLQRKPNVAPRVITGVYVGLSGRSLRSLTTEVSINMTEDTEVTDEIVRKLREQALNTAIDSSLEIVDAIPRIYMVGKLETRSPKGAIGNRIEATYDLIVCRRELRRNLTRTLQDKVGIKVCGFIVTPLSTAQVILKSEEKRLGCMLVDMGAETTSVSIYKDGALRYLSVLPLGGRNITRDITSMSVLEERAEEIKITSGHAIAQEGTSTLNMEGIRFQDVSNLIVARSEEIVANIVEQIKYAGLKDNDLPGGLICIGGGSRLDGMDELLKRQTTLNVRHGQLPSYITVEDTRTSASENLEVSSILYSGASETENECLSEPKSEELPVTGEGNREEMRGDNTRPDKPRKTKNNGWFSRLMSRGADIFKNDDDDSDLLE